MDHHTTSTINVTALAMLLPVLAAGCFAISSGGGAGYRALVDSTPPQTVTVPVAGVRRSQLRDGWGSPRSGGRKHEGIDIFARRGTPVMSATGGYVTRIGETDLGGQSVSVLGPGGYSHYYAHLDRYADQKVGEWVDEGDTIGFVGNSGNAKGTPPHLHYGIYTVEGADQSLSVPCSTQGNQTGRWNETWVLDERRVRAVWGEIRS